MKQMFYDDVLVRVKADDMLIAIKTFSREVGRKGRFLILKEMFSEWVERGEMHAFKDEDCGNVLSILKVGDKLHFKLYWISKCGNKLSGYEQCFDISADDFFKAVNSEEHTKFLCRDKNRKSSIKVYGVQVIKRVKEDPLKKRAFIKAMRDCFGYGDCTVRLYEDGANDFYFRTNGVWCTNGGLILHDSTVQSGGKTYPRVFYSVHT